TKRRVTHAVLPSFPTRRASDLHEDRTPGVPHVGTEGFGAFHGEDTGSLELDRKREPRGGPPAQERDDALRAGREAKRSVGVGRRSEEHTSELQSRSELVCRLLL